MIKVIIVEDDPMVRDINKKYVAKMEGMQVYALLKNGKEALEYLEKDKADIVIADLYMPEMNGLELLKEMRIRNIDAELIMVTAANDMASIQEAMRFGILDYLVKPFTFERFKAALEKYKKKYNILGKSNDLSQKDIDDIINIGQTNINKDINNNDLKKGINLKTLEEIRIHLEMAKPKSLTSEELSKMSGFSMVTIRRYMNYLIEKDIADSFIDYKTGGRPSVHYLLKD